MSSAMAVTIAMGIIIVIGLMMATIIAIARGLMKVKWVTIDRDNDDNDG